MSLATQPYRLANHYALLFAYFIGISLIAPGISNRKMLRINSELTLLNTKIVWRLKSNLLEAFGLPNDRTKLVEQLQPYVH